MIAKAFLGGMPDFKDTFKMPIKLCHAIKYALK